MYPNHPNSSNTIPPMNTLPEPSTLNTVAELAFWAAIRVNPLPLAWFDRTLSTVPAYAPLSIENTSIALVAASAPAVVLVSASVLLTVTAPVSVDVPVIVAFPPTDNVLLTVTAPVSVDAPVIVAAPLTANELPSATAPVIVAAPLNANELLSITAPETDSVPVTVTNPSPLTENFSAAFELACVRAKSTHSTRRVYRHTQHTTAPHSTRPRPHQHARTFSRTKSVPAAFVVLTVSAVLVSEALVADTARATAFAKFVIVPPPAET
jgi:hypothetical protein